MIDVVVPMKALAQAKSRLAAVLEPQQRQQLAVTMLTHVLRVITALPNVARAVVVTADPLVERLAQQYRALVVPDPGSDLNGALEAARVELQQRGATALMVLPADLPLIQVSDVQALIAAVPTRGIVLVPAHDGGTNALLLRPLDLPLRFCFGVNSYQQHRRLAEIAGINVVTITNPQLTLDIDNPEDLDALLECGATCSASQLLLGCRCEV